MAEEETGFTFVDKRRTAPEPAAAVPPSAEPQALQSQVYENALDEPGADDLTADNVISDDVTADDLAPAEAAPTTYDMIGYCINLLASQAWQKLGLLADPQTGEAQPNLEEAKLAIDAVGDLAARLDSAPETIIPSDLRRELRTLVNDLRLNYVSQRGPAS